jgi:hypothetical protein
MQKAKKEDFRVEEELRSQKAKYEESSEDVVRRMQDIKEAETDSVADLGAFLDAELEYYDRCRDELLRLKRDWPAGYVFFFLQLLQPLTLMPDKPPPLPAKTEDLPLDPEPILLIHIKSDILATMNHQCRNLSLFDRQSVLKVVFPLLPD